MPRPRKSQKTRQRLLETGLTHLAERGYAGTGIKEIVDAVGVPKGSFYNYFESKEQFCVEIIRFYTEQLSAEYHAVVALWDGDALGALRKVFEWELNRQKDQGFKPGCLVGNLTAEIGDTSQACCEAMDWAKEQWIKGITTLLVAGQGEGTVRKDLGAEQLAEFLWSAWQGSLLGMKHTKSVEPLEKCLDLVLDDFFRASKGGR